MVREQFSGGGNCLEVNYPGRNFSPGQLSGGFIFPGGAVFLGHKHKSILENKIGEADTKIPDTNQIITQTLLK